MLYKKGAIAFVILGLVLSGCLISLKADYYQDDLFPIGLTGFVRTNANMVNNCPYSKEDNDWRWDDEYRMLVDELEVNCIGSEDAYQYYLLNFSNYNDTNNYLNRVCKHSYDSSKTVYLITASYGGRRQYIYYDTLAESCESASCSTEVWSTAPTPSSAFLRCYLRVGGGVGSVAYRPTRGSTVPGCFGTDWDNWAVCDGDTVWKEMADSAINVFYYYFKNDSFNLAPCIWGFNLITEDPAISRHDNPKYSAEQWHGAWAAVDYVFTGHHNGKFTALSEDEWDTIGGFRGIEDSVFGNTNRMIIAKGATWPMHKMGYNIFEWLPDLDAFVLYCHGWCMAKYNYGNQVFFDNFLYATESKKTSIYLEKAGFHNAGVYFQLYGNSPGPTGQKRRWMPGLCLEWRGVSTDGTKAAARRPCPPEIRCATYLCLSRGAKGILFHPWLTSTGEKNSVYPNVPVPYTGSDYGKGNVGLRDHEGDPFGDKTITYHKLNNGTGSTYWHTDSTARHDHTYYYLDTLIEEIKKISPKLMELDWINGYSLNSTSPEWRSPCPHYYVEDVWGVDYMELAFFDHPYEPVGVEYFMLVNREGIADMTNRNVGVALDASHWPESDTLILTDMANADNPRTIRREGDRFVFTEVFEPGEGKLYRVAPTNEASITLVPSTEGGVR